MSRYHVSVLILVSLLVIVAACQPKQTSETPATSLQASLHELSGDVQARPSAQAEFVTALEGMLVEVGGQVRTAEQGRARIDLANGTIIRVAPLSTFTLEANQETDGGMFTRLRLEAGKVWVILNGGSLDVDTPSGVASVRGSYLSVDVQPDGSVKVTCLEGTCRLENAGGSVELTAGQSTLVTGANDPPEQGQMSDEDFQDWLNNNPEAELVIPTEPPPDTEVPSTETPIVTETPVVTESPNLPFNVPDPILIPPSDSKEKEPKEPIETENPCGGSAC